MKLWKLTYIPGASYNQYAGFVVRATTEIEARQIANNKANEWGNRQPIENFSCEQLNLNGPSEIILEDYWAG
jgi:hypothetical protein